MCTHALDLPQKFRISLDEDTELIYEWPRMIDQPDNKSICASVQQGLYREETELDQEVFEKIAKAAAREFVSG